MWDLLSSSSSSLQAKIAASVWGETGKHCLTQTLVQLITEKMTNRSGSAIRMTEQDTSGDQERKREMMLL